MYPELISPRLEKFFVTAKERHIIYIVKQCGLPRPWSADSQFNTWYFCNVFRQLDKVTVWIKKNVIDVYADDPDLWAKIILARRLSRIESMEAVKKAGGFDDFDRARETLNYMKAVGIPVITNAFIMGIPDPSLGDNKVDYIFNLIEFYRKLHIAEFLETKPSIERMTIWLKQAPNMAGFLSYEVASDFTYCRYLKDAPDTYTWANPGPGCKRGLNVILYGVPNFRSIPDEIAVMTMGGILSSWREYVRIHLDDWMAEAARRAGADNREYAVTEMSRFYSLTMREVEHWLCEFDKHERVGKNKRRY